MRPPMAKIARQSHLLGSLCTSLLLFGCGDVTRDGAEGSTYASQAGNLGCFGLERVGR